MIARTSRRRFNRKFVSKRHVGCFDSLSITIPDNSGRINQLIVSLRDSYEIGRELLQRGLRDKAARIIEQSKKGPTFWLFDLSYGDV